MLDCLYDQLKELDDCQEKGAEGKGTEVVAEDHFVGPEDGEVCFICVRTVGVVPDATGTGDDKDSDGLEEGIAP